MDYFQDATTQRFTFVSYASGVSETTFAVLRFKGLEAISTPYEFEIMLVSGDPDLDMSAILQSQAVFTIHRDAGDDVTYNGILAEFDQLHAYNEHYFYRAKLVPKIWWLMQTQHNQVFLEKTVPEIIEGALVDGGMDSLDYDLSALEGTYNPVEYVCQYGESHFNFVSRWLEREGVYYYFYHDADGDKLVLSDSSFSHEPFQQGADLVYSPKTGMEQGHLDEIIINFTCRQKQLPNRIVLKDHNPERPSLEMAVRADVDPDGRGESFLYGEHYGTPEEGERLITFRVEELLCQKQAFHGDSTVPFLTPGFKFTMNQHYRSAFNQEYMVTSVTHEGDQTNLLKTSVIGSLSEDAEINIYSNSFTAIPADRQYRHPRTADRPRISGTLHGKIDGEQNSPYAQLDEQGRYKVKLPFDINDDHIDGKASARVRMMQPYAGEGKGMQFPLTKGTEVLLTFIDGNPDRPVIAGAVSTETAPSPVNADNQSESVIQSAGNNRIRMEDKSGKERIVLQSPTSGTWLRVGATNDPMTLKGESPELHMQDSVWEDFGANTIDPETERPTSTIVKATWLRLESEVDQVDPEPENYLGESLPEGRYIARYVNGTDTLSRTVLSFDLEDETHEFYKKLGAPGIRWATSGSYWYEARGRVGSYQTGYPNYAESDAQDHDGRKYIDALLTGFTGPTPAYEPQGLRDYATGDPVSLLSVMKQGSVEVSSLDTVTTQEGNIYDFGGYWNYNLGNSYEEAHMDQKAILNRPGSLDNSAKNDATKIFGDLLKSGGPGWAEIDWIDDKGIDSKLPGTDAEWSSGNVWTTKQFGNSYDFREGHAVSVNNGSTLDVSYTGNKAIEVVMRKSGDPASWTHSSGGVTQEKKWTPQGIVSYESVSAPVKNGDTIIGSSSVATKRDVITGGIQNYKAEASSGMASTSFEFDYGNSATAKFAFSSSLSFNTSASANIAMSISATLNLSLEINALELSLKAPFSGITVSSDYKGGTKISVPGCSIDIEGPGPDIKVKTSAPTLEVSSATFKKVVSELEWQEVNLAGGLVKIFG